MLGKLMQERLSEAMRAKGMGAKALADAAGVPEEKIRLFLDEGQVPDHEAMNAIADALQVSVAYLMDWSTLYPESEDAESALLFNIIGSITADKDGHIVENDVDSWETIPQPWLLGESPESYFLTVTQDTAMRPTILPGDLLFVRKAPAAPNGSVVIVLMDGGSASPRIIHYDDQGAMIRLEALDPYYPERIIEGDELARCHVIGQVKRVLRTLSNER